MPGAGRWAAVPTRLRQELEKRLAVGAGRAARALGWSGHSSPSDAALGLGTTRVLPPWALTLTRGRPAPADAKALIAEADDCVEGRFSVFGSRLPAFEEDRDWLTDPVSGASNPSVPWFRVPFASHGGDVKVYWELNRHHALLRLAQAYHLEGDERFADSLRALLGSWIDQDRPGIGLNWASTLEVAFRAASWCWVWVLTAGSPVWDRTFLRAFLWRLRDHASHVHRYDSSHHSPNTHLTGEAISLLYVAETFPAMRGAARWRARAIRVLLREAEKQILDDGMHFERATCYHRYTLEFYLHFLFLAGHTAPGLVPEVQEIVARLVGAASVLRRADGAWPVLGDEDGGRFLRLSSAMPVDATGLVGAAASAVGLTVPDPAAAACEAWWLAIPAQPEPPAGFRPPTALPDAGYYPLGVCDGTPGRWSALIDLGPLGALGGGHGHADLGHIELSYGSCVVVADPGCGVYGADPALRDWFRSERAHARPVVTSHPLAIEGGTFAWRSGYGRPECWVARRRDHWHAAVRYALQGGGERVVHTRHALLFPERGLIVLDWFEASGPIGGSVRWPLAQPASLDRAGEVATAGVRLGWLAVGPDCALGPPRLEPCQRAPSYGQIEEGMVADVPFAGRGSLGVVSTVSCAKLVQDVRSDGSESIELTLADEATQRVLRLSRSRAGNLVDPAPSDARSRTAR